MRGYVTCLGTGIKRVVNHGKQQLLLVEVVVSWKSWERRRIAQQPPSPNGSADGDGADGISNSYRGPRIERSSWEQQHCWFCSTRWQSGGNNDVYHPALWGRRSSRFDELVKGLSAATAAAATPNRSDDLTAGRLLNISERCWTDASIPRGSSSRSGPESGVPGACRRPRRAGAVSSRRSAGPIAPNHHPAGTSRTAESAGGGAPHQCSGGGRWGCSDVDAGCPNESTGH